MFSDAARRLVADDARTRGYVTGTPLVMVAVRAS